MLKPAAHGPDSVSHLSAPARGRSGERAASRSPCGPPVRGLGAAWPASRWASPGHPLKAPRVDGLQQRPAARPVSLGKQVSLRQGPQTWGRWQHNGDSLLFASALWGFKTSWPDSAAREEPLSSGPGGRRTAWGRRLTVQCAPGPVPVPVLSPCPCPSPSLCQPHARPRPRARVHPRAHPRPRARPHPRPHPHVHPRARPHPHACPCAHPRPHPRACPCARPLKGACALTCTHFEDPVLRRQDAIQHQLLNTPPLRFSAAAWGGDPRDRVSGWLCSQGRGPAGGGGAMNQWRAVLSGWGTPSCSAGWGTPSCSPEGNSGLRVGGAWRPEDLPKRNHWEHLLSAGHRRVGLCSPGSESVLRDRARSHQWGDRGGHFLKAPQTAGAIVGI